MPQNIILSDEHPELNIKQTWLGGKEEFIPFYTNVSLPTECHLVGIKLNIIGVVPVPIVFPVCC